jgi:hypothetical protein
MAAGRAAHPPRALAQPYPGQRMPQPAHGASPVMLAQHGRSGVCALPIAASNAARATEAPRPASSPTLKGRCSARGGVPQGEVFLKGRCSSRGGVPQGEVFRACPHPPYHHATLHGTATHDSFLLRQALRYQPLLPHRAAIVHRYWTDFRARTVLSDEMRAARAASEWLYSVPWGLRKLLSWIKRR